MTREMVQDLAAPASPQHTAVTACLWCDEPTVDGTGYCARHIGEARQEAIREIIAEQDAPAELLPCIDCGKLTTGKFCYHCFQVAKL